MINNTIKTPVKNNILEVDITNASSEDILKYVDESLKNTDEKIAIVTPNPEIIVYANKHPEFKDILNINQIALPDGVGVVLSGKILGKPFKERIPGVDFMKKLCAYASRNAVTVGFIGGRNGVAMLTAERLQKEYPGLKVEFVGEEFDECQMSNVKCQISNKKKPNIPSIGGVAGRPGWVTAPKTSQSPQSLTCDILFVAFGFPKQEEWMYHNIDKLNIRVMMGVGGAFDYISGSIPRAPLPIRKIGLEWLFRLIIQPWRWRRQLALMEFGWLILKERFSSKD